MNQICHFLSGDVFIVGSYEELRRAFINKFLDKLASVKKSTRSLQTHGESLDLSLYKIVHYELTGFCEKLMIDNLYACAFYQKKKCEPFEINLQKCVDDFCSELFSANEEVRRNGKFVN